MILIGVYAFIVAMMVLFIIYGVRKNKRDYSGGDNFIVGGIFGSVLAAFLWTVIGFLAIGSSLEPNQINNHTSSLESLVEQAGGTGGGAYVRVDYVNRHVPEQVVTYAAGGKLHRLDGTQVVIRTVKDIRDARVVRQEYFSHYPTMYPMYSAYQFQDRYVIYVPKTAIIYGETDQAVDEGND